MQDFVNNFWAEVSLAQGATSLALALPDGSYVLTLSDALGAEATVWEVVLAEVASGTATLTRAQEGTDDLEWPEGSFVYCSLTAGFLDDLQQQVQTAAEFPAKHSLSGAGAPSTNPPAINAHYVNTDFGSIFLAIGTDSPEQWVQVEGFRLYREFNATTTPQSFALDRENRRVAVTDMVGAGLAGDLTLEYPAWSAQPYGHRIDINLLDAASITLRLDCSVFGVPLTFYINDDGVSHSASVSGSGTVLDLTLNAAARLEMTSFYVDEEVGEIFFDLTSHTPLTLNTYS